MGQTSDGGNALPPMYDGCSVGMAFISPDGVLRACNDTYARLLATPREWLIGSAAGSGAGEEGLRAVLDRARVDGQATGTWDLTVGPGSGLTRTLKLSASPVAADPGLATGFLVVVDDVSESVRVQATLRRSEERLRSLLEMQAVGCDETARKEAEEALRRYGTRLIDMEESLRRSLATELHDEIGRDLTSLGLNLSVIAARLPAGSMEQVGTKFEDAQRLVIDISRAIRGLMARLRPPVLDDYGLPAALRWHADLFSQRTGLDVAVHISESFPRLAPAKEVALFRIAQEALTNAAKHSGAGLITIELRGAGRRVRLAIGDDGHGFSPGEVGTPRPESGWGMTIMQERAASIGGRLELRSAVGEGSCVSVEVPEGL